MEHKSLLELIKNQAKAEINALIASGKREAEAQERAILAQAEKQAEALVKTAQGRADQLISQKENETHLLEKQYLESLKRSYLDDLFNTVFNQLNLLQDQDLLDLVVSLLKKVSLTGNEKIAVHPQQVKKYQKALCSSGSITDLLAKELAHPDWRITLVAGSELIGGGFILIGSDYDLSFAFSDLIENLQTQLEQELAEQIHG